MIFFFSFRNILKANKGNDFIQVSFSSFFLNFFYKTIKTRTKVVFKNVSQGCKSQGLKVKKNTKPLHNIIMIFEIVDL